MEKLVWNLYWFTTKKLSIGSNRFVQTEDMCRLKQIVRCGLDWFLIYAFWGHFGKGLPYLITGYNVNGTVLI